MENWDILASYRESLHNTFHADISPVNFGESEEAARRVNSWVRDMTNKNIDKLIEKDMVNDNTRLILVNALYFKGDWEEQFDKKNTAQDKFFLPDGKSVLVDMMVQESEIPYAVLDSIGSTMVELPYKGDRQGSIFYQIFEEWTNSRPDFRRFCYRNSHQLTIYFSSKPHMLFWQNIDP